MIEGKTIARVIDAEGYGGSWLVFADGSGIELEGWEDGAGYREVTADQIAEHEAKIAEKALQAEIAQARQEAWMMRSCDERAEIRSEWLAAQPKTLISHGMADLMMDEFVWDANRVFFGEQPKIRARCPKCNERGCENAPLMKPKNRGVFYSATTITVPKL